MASTSDNTTVFKQFDDSSDTASTISVVGSWSSWCSQENLTGNDQDGGVGERGDDGSDDDEYDEDDEDDDEELVQHPQCLYEDIGSRDMSAELKNKLLWTPKDNRRLRDLFIAQAKKYAFIETRQTCQLLRVQEATEERWAQLLTAEYQRQARAELDVLEAKIADRIQGVIGDTRADILVLRLRAPLLMSKFVFQFYGKRRLTPEDLTYVDRLIPRYRTPSALDINSHRSWLLKGKIDRHRKKQLPELLRRCGYREQPGGWSIGGTFTKSFWISVGKLIPDFLPEYLAQYIFGRGTAHANSTGNTIPMLRLGFGQGFLAPAMPQDRNIEFVDSALLESSSSSEKWIYVDLDAAWMRRANPEHAQQYIPLKLVEFKTPLRPNAPDHRYAYLHVLLSMLRARRAEGPDGSWRQDIEPFLREERPTLVGLAATIGLMDDSETHFIVGIDEDTVQTDAEDTAEMDMLLANIFEECLFPSPVVRMNELELEPLDLRETDIIAVMQRRRDPQHVRENRDYDNLW
ncbi:hypothetical protein HDK64DRAFT_251122 [Phyllosticta capitalensis]